MAWPTPFRQSRRFSMLTRPMDVISTCALPVGSVLWQTATGQWTLTVVARATFVLLPGESPLAPEQDPPQDGDRYWNDDELCSLRAADDLVPFKRRADVLVVGTAYAPHRQPVYSLTARVLVGDVDKGVEVWGNRAFGLDGALRDGLRFTTMPLHWERAAGGPETANPVGLRLDLADARGMTPLPNLQPPGLHVTSRRDFIPPVGFGPLAPWWPSRLGKLHRGLSGWDFRGWRRAPLPADLDPGYFNAAPADQQCDTLRANERVVLENLHHEHPRLATSLTAVKPRALLEQPGMPAQEFGMRCDTLLVDTDRGTCTLTWRGQIPLAHAAEAGRVVVTTGRDEPRRRTSTPAPALGVTQDLPAPPRAASQPPLGALGANQTRTIDASTAGVMPTLPFRVGRSPLAGTVLGAPPAPPPIADDDSVSTLVPAHAPPEDEDTWDRPPPAFVAPVSWSPVAEPSYASVWPEREVAPPPPAPAPPPVIEPPPPPALIGPLATPEMVAAAEPPADEPTAEPAAAEPAAPAELPLDRYPLERCAAIAASLARTRAARDAILAEHELDLATWEALDRHHREAVQAQAGRGRTAPLKAYDAAYVAQLEKERGVIRVDDYARLVVAQERGADAEELSEMGLPRGALLRLQRVWLARTTADAELARALRQAVEAAREA